MGVIIIPAISSKIVTLPLSAVLTAIMPKSKTAMIQMDIKVLVLRKSFTFILRAYLDSEFHSAVFSSDFPVPSATQSRGA